MKLDNDSSEVLGMVKCFRRNQDLTVSCNTKEEEEEDENFFCNVGTPVCDNCTRCTV